MDANLLTTLQDKMSSFSKGQKMLAKYISQAYEDAAFMTAAKLGEMVGVSESTVVRFATELGFDGYPGLQKAMQALLRSPAAVNEVEHSDVDIASRTLLGEMDNLRFTAMLFDKAVFDKIVKTIRNSKKIYIIGTKTNALLAEYLGYYLQFLFGNVYIITDSGVAEVMEKLIHVAKEDVVIGINFTSHATTTVKALQYCRSTGAKIVGFSDGKPSVTKPCDYVLQAKCSKDSFGASMAGPFALMTALIAGLSEDHESIINENLGALERIFDAYDVIEK